MDKTKLNQQALAMAEDLIKARPSIPLSVAMAVVNYKMANICSQLHVNVDTKSGYGLATVNLYYMVLASSGVGKNSSLGLIDTFYFKDAFDYIKTTVYPKFKDAAMETIEAAGQEREIHSWVPKISNATISGMYAYAESFMLSGIGGLNIEVDEVANAVISKAELFEILLTPYDKGDFVPVAKRTDPNSMDISGMPVNLYCFGNKVRLLEGDNVETAFMNLLDEGYGRRCIFVDDASIRPRKTPQDVLNEMTVAEELKSLRSEDRDRIKSLVCKQNLNKVMELTDEARLMFATIKAEGDNFILDNKGLTDAVKSDIAERNFKTAKLASAYAFFEGRDNVSKKNMEEAFEVIKESSQVLTEIRKVKPKHERLLERLLEEPEMITSQTMLRYPFIPSSWTKKIDEYINLAQELASERGLIWEEVKRKGVSYYKVEEKTSQTSKKLDEIDEQEDKVVKETQELTEESLLAFLE